MINLIIYVISTLSTYILGILSKKYDWAIPIPVQNIMIGISCFAGVILFDIVCNQSIDFESTVPAIIAALGGAGTATLCYDTKKSMKGD